MKQQLAAEDVTDEDVSYSCVLRSEPWWANRCWFQHCL